MIKPKIIYPVNTGYVNSLSPTLHGTGQPGSTINGLLNGTPFSCSVGQNGIWSYSVQQQLPNQTPMTLSITQTDHAGKVSLPENVSFRTDTTPMPAHTVNYPINNGSINTSLPTISGTGKPGATIEVTMPDGVYSTLVNINGAWQVKITDPLQDGFVSASILQKDMGNCSQPLTINFTIDTITPSKPVLESPIEGSILNTSRPVIAGSGEANATISTTVDNKTYTTQVNPQGHWNVEISEPLVEDTHIVAAKQRDAAGNESQEEMAIFSVKTRQPTPPIIIEPVNGGFISQDHPTLKGKGERDCKVEVVVYDRVYVKNVDENGNWELEFSERLKDGPHTFKAYQVDEAGNVSPNTELTVKIDTTVPSAPVILYPQEDAYVNNTVFTVKGTGEPGAEVECVLADKEYKVKVCEDGSWQFTVEEGLFQYKIPYSISVKQVDAAGNVSTGAKTTFRVDTETLQAPKVTEPADSSTIRQTNPVITGQAKPGATVDIKINNQTLTCKASSEGLWSAACTQGLSQGENTLYVTQTDKGNVSPVATVRFKISMMSPKAPGISYPAEGLVLNAQNLTLKGSGLPGAKVNIKLDDKGYTTTVQKDGNWVYGVAEPQENGAHSLLVSQADTAGNESGFTAVNFIVFIQKPITLPDNTPTTCKVTYNPAGPGWTTKTIVTFRTSKPVTVDKVYGSVFSKIISCNGIKSFSLVTPQSMTGELSSGVTWIDNTPPVIQIDYTGNYFESDKTVHYYKPEGSPIRAALLNGTPFESGRKVNQEGIYQIEVTDQAGNTAKREVIIDKTPPEISGFTDQMTYQTDVTVSFSDTLSGVQSALLNGQNILPNSVVTANGDYTLIVTDYAGHVTRKIFHIAK